MFLGKVMNETHPQHRLHKAFTSSVSMKIAGRRRRAWLIPRMATRMIVFQNTWERLESFQPWEERTLPLQHRLERIWVEPFLKSAVSWFQCSEEMIPARVLRPDCITGHPTPCRVYRRRSFERRFLFELPANWNMNLIRSVHQVVSLSYLHDLLSVLHSHERNNDSRRVLETMELILVEKGVTWVVYWESDRHKSRDESNGVQMNSPHV